MASLTTNHVTVVGCGIMGSGIAMITAANGYHVTVVDVNEEALSRGRRQVEEDLQRMAMHVSKGNEQAAKKFYERASARLSYSTNLKQVVSTTDLAIEAIVEKLDKKQTLFKTIDQAAPPHTIIATNTSSLSVKDIGAFAERQDRIGGLHFFNPVPLMKLVEVIRTDQTSTKTEEALVNFAKSLRKTTVVCKDNPGFLVNRLLFPVISEALAMVERGDATVKDIDVAMKLGLGHPMGPFELMDIVGLDTVLNIQEQRRDSTTSPNALLDAMVKDDKLGVKTGEGFYSYK